MRVLHVIDSLGPGGAETSLADLLPALRDRGVDSVVAPLRARRDGPAARIAGAGFDVRVLDVRSRIAAVRAVRRCIRDVRPDLVHTTLFEADLAGRLASAWCRVPAVSSVVNTSYAPERRADPGLASHRLAAARALDGLTARHLTRRLHAVTPAVRDAAVTTLGVAPDRVTVVRRGRDLARLGEPSPGRREAVRHRLGVAPGTDLVVAVGRHEHQKGFDVLLDAVATSAAARPRLRVLVAGRPGNATGMLESRLDALGLGDRVAFLGHRDDVPDLLAAADVMVSTSRYEGAGGVLLEAMALAVPVVATALPTLDGVVASGHTALVVPVDDADAVAQAVALLLDDRGLGAWLGARGRAHVTSHFALDRSADGMVAFYREALGDGAAASTSDAASSRNRPDTSAHR